MSCMSWCHRCDAVIQPIDMEICADFCPACRPKGPYFGLSLAHWQEKFQRIGLLGKQSSRVARGVPNAIRDSLNL